MATAAEPSHDGADGPMPELPEVETIRRDLEREVVGKRVKTVEVTGTRIDPPPARKKQFISRLEGAKVTGVDRGASTWSLKLDTRRRCSSSTCA